VTGLSNFEPSSSSLAKAEALGLFKAVQFAIDKNMFSVVFESDSKFVVDMINSAFVPHNETGDIISRCKDLLAARNNYTVRHIRRQANRVAHTIGRASLSHPSPHIFSDVPDYLYSLIINEMT